MHNVDIRLLNMYTIENQKCSFLSTYSSVMTRTTLHIPFFPSRHISFGSLQLIITAKMSDHEVLIRVVLDVMDQ